ncbi:MAG: hypothetical protein PHF21_04510 [Bacilli bacterium]|nr:hypothetical protein [Bacilli bacterium]
MKKTLILIFGVIALFLITNNVNAWDDDNYIIMDYDNISFSTLMVDKLDELIDYLNTNYSDYYFEISLQFDKKIDYSTPLVIKQVSIFISDDTPNYRAYFRSGYTSALQISSFYKSLNYNAISFSTDNFPNNFNDFFSDFNLDKYVENKTILAPSYFWAHVLMIDNLSSKNYFTEHKRASSGAAELIYYQSEQTPFSYSENNTPYIFKVKFGNDYNDFSDNFIGYYNYYNSIDTLTLNKLDMWKLKEGDTTKIDYIDWNMIFYYYGEELGGNKFYISDITLSDINNYSIYRAPIYENAPNWEYVDTYNLEDNILNISEVDNFVVSEFNSLAADYLYYQYKVRFNFKKDRVIPFLATYDFAPFENYVDTKCIYRFIYHPELEFGDTICYENNSFISPVADFLKDLKKVRVPKNVKYMILSSDNLTTEKKLISYVFPYDSRVYNYDLFNNSIIDVDDYFKEYKSHFDYYEYRKTFTENDIWYIENFNISNDFDIWVSSDVVVSFIIDNVDNEIIIDNEIIVVDKPPYNDDRFNEQGNVINDNSSQNVLSLFNSSFDAFVNTIKIIFLTIGDFFIVLPLVLKQFFITIFILSILLYIFRFLV